VTGLVNVEEQLVKLVAQQLSANQTHHALGVIKHELKSLVKVEDKIAALLDKLADQGLADDAMLQQEQASLLQIDADLAALIAQTKK